MKTRMSGGVSRVPAPPGMIARLVAAIAVAGVLAGACDVHTPTGVGSLRSITVSPDVTLAVGAKQQFVAVGVDAEGREVELSPDWKILAGGGAIDDDGLFTAGMKPGLYTATVEASEDGVSGTATVTVTVGPLAQIDVTPNPTLAINGTQQFTAVGTDIGGNVLAITPTWSVVAGGGAVNQSGAFTAGTVLGVFTKTVKATNGSISGTSTVTVIAGPVATLLVTPNPKTLETGETQQFTVVARDAGNNIVTATPVWSVVDGGGSISSSGMFTAGSSAGTYTNTVRAVSGGASGFATVIVSATPAPPTPPTPPAGPGPLSSIEVTPNPETLGVNTTQQFTAVGKDASGNLVTISPTWSVTAGGGAISSSGMFTAGSSAGSFPNTVRATSGSISGSATVIVTATPPTNGPLATITVTPNPETLGVSETQQFTAVGRDGNGNVVTITPSWALVAGGGTLSSTGMFTAGTVAGPYPNTVRATSGTISGSATVIVMAAPPPPPPPPPPAVTVNLGAAGSHGILAGSTITCVALGTVNADASVWPGSAITGFPPCVITGARHAADAFAQTAQGDLTTAYNQLAAMPCGATITANLGGQTLQPGVYCSTSTVGLTGEMFLNGLGDPNAIFVIKAASSLTTAAAAVTLLNGAQAKNVYWLVGSSATLGVSSAMKGNIITLTSITLVDNSTLVGRALARNGAVTLGTSNTITLP